MKAGIRSYSKPYSQWSMRQLASLLGVVFFTITLCSTSLAQTPDTETLPPGTNPAQHAIYPADSQSSDQQMSDQLEAYRWATQQTGWDPYQAHAKLVEQGYVAQETADATEGAAVRGAARGALVGVAVGAIAGDAGKGAAIGAAAGGMTGGMRGRRTREAAASQSQQAVDEFNRKFADWDKFYVALMEGKKYSVK
jgi:hypothetical protein